ncbi:LLM class flavin-dependent oxidoreductase [Kribbella kalugense]|uniref:Luciferase-like monooxygenase n=1 Tax=Kribbella kalugense TaxID=2512221 RepID=A0A4R7ZVW2_9ACTN|nr:LLM class flavin-dependent oxidoreductase [Kribbella kalugense]TDW22239.1 luciferase-like monooxygenase [Kribbella kalugense]
MVELQVVLPDESAAMPPERLVELAVAAEELGYGTAWLPDHLLPPGDFGSTYGGVYEPLVTIGYLAARTTRIRFGTSVLVLPMRSAYVVAKQAATLHRLSGERIVLGVGAGWAAAEFAAVGASFEERGRRTDESLGIIRDLFEGRDRGGVFEPKLRAPLPIMIGGTTTPALRRAARFGDEWQGLGLDGAGFSAAVARLRSFGERPVKVGTRLDWSSGDPGPVVAQAQELTEAGAETIAVSFGDETGALDRMTRFRGLFTAG